MYAVVRTLFPLRRGTYVAPWWAEIVFSSARQEQQRLEAGDETIQTWLRPMREQIRFFFFFSNTVNVQDHLANERQRERRSKERK